MTSAPRWLDVSGAAEQIDRLWAARSAERLSWPGFALASSAVVCRSESALVAHHVELGDYETAARALTSMEIAGAKVARDLARWISS